MKTVLITGDNVEDRGMVRQSLECDAPRGYRCFEESDTAQALQRIWIENPACTFLDDEVPDCPALDFLKSIKDVNGSVPVPVVILTSTGNQSAAVALMREGAHDCLAKADVEAESPRLAMVSHEAYTPPTPVLSLGPSTLEGSGILSDLGETFSLSQSIVEAHGGAPSVKSGSEDHGTAFPIRLANADAPSAARPRPHIGIERVPLRGKTILIVEDHEDTRRALARSLRRRGFDVTAAASVAAACEQFALQTPDLVICDIGLPDGTGWDAIARLRARGPVRAIAVSGYGTEHDVQRSIVAGFAAHITKPVDFARLEKVIESLLENGPT